MILPQNLCDLFILLGYYFRSTTREGDTIMVNIRKEEIAGLIGQFDKLQTFADATDWDNRVQTEIEHLSNTCRTIDAEISKRQLRLQEIEQEREQKPVIARMFGGKKEERQLQRDITELEGLKASCQNLIGNLQSRVDITPNNAEDQRRLLNELRLEKAELQIKKRALNARIREINVEARQKTADIPNTLTGVIGGSKYRAATRRSIRYNKEARLAPHEDEKSSIERELIHLEKDTVWEQKFKGEGSG